MLPAARERAEPPPPAPPAPASRACAEAPLTPPSPPVRSFSSPLSDVSATPPPILSVALLPVAEAAGPPPEGSQLQARNSKRLELLATTHYHALPRTTSHLLPARRAAEPASSGGRVPTTWPLTRSSAVAACSGPRGVGSVATRCAPGWLTTGLPLRPPTTSYPPLGGPPLATSCSSLATHHWPLTPHPSPRTPHPSPRTARRRAWAASSPLSSPPPWGWSRRATPSSSPRSAWSLPCPCPRAPAQAP